MGWNGVGWEGRVGWIEGKKSEGFVLVGIAISLGKVRGDKEGAGI